MNSTSKPLTETEKKAFHSKVTESLWAYEEIPTDLRDRIRDYLVGDGDATCLLDLASAYQDDDRKKFFRIQYGEPRAVDRVERKKLAGLVTITRAPEGYYERLGEFARRIPEVTQVSRSGEGFPEWFLGLMKLRLLLVSDGTYVYYNGEHDIDKSFFLSPYIGDFESDGDYASLISAAISVEEHPYEHISHGLRPACDWPEILSRFPVQVADALQSAPALCRESALVWFTQCNFDFIQILPAICKLAVSSSKKVRPLAVNVLRKHAEQATPTLTELLSKGKAAERPFAAEALVSILGEKAQPILSGALESEKSDRIRSTIESLLGSVAATEDEEESEEAVTQLPPIEMPSGEVALPRGFGEQLWEHLEATLDQQDRAYERDREAYEADSSRLKPRKPNRISREDFDKALEYISGRREKSPNFLQRVQHLFAKMPLWSKWTDLKELHLVHVLRFMRAFDLLSDRRQSEVHFYQDNWLEDHRGAQDKPYGLREVDAACAATGMKHGVIANSYLDKNDSWSTFLDWEPDAVWPLFIEHADIFRDALMGVSRQSNDYYIADRRHTAIKVAAMMPTLSREIESVLWSIALGEAKTDRAICRRALTTSKRRLERSLKALEDGKQAIRIAAAEMLMEVNDPAAVEPLKKALKKEKQEIVKGSLLQAVEHLGGTVDEFLGREVQLAEAKKGLKKKLPKGMEWLDLDALPEMRWSEDDQLVAKEILQWWIIRSIQFKLPTCGPILRRSLERCRPDDAAALARHLLAAWIGYDTATRPMEEIVAEATENARHCFSGSDVSFYEKHYGNEESMRKQLIQAASTTYTNSAIGQKGLLALVSAAGDRECVRMTERYIRKHHGQRLAQSKSLLEILGHIEDTSAVQLLLSIGNRFRTKSIRKRAEELVQELADRQGWTMDQLADRTIPDAGFVRETDGDGNPIGERAELVVDYGSRKFSVILGDDLQPVITRDDGKQVKSLPSAAKDDDPELVKAAKKEFSAAKKTVKEVVKNQAERFYEAVCVQRCWPIEEWKTYLAMHPIAGALCRRVIWAAVGPDPSEPPRLFRPLEDGSLTDVEDNEFELKEMDEVRIAHSSMLDEETESAWKQHLVDYEVPELFQQFGRPTYRLPEALEKETDITDFRGHMLTTFLLRNRATKLGYVRGEILDGGCFSTYHKAFRSEGIEAVIEFTGSYVPEEDLQAALRELYFVPLKPGEHEGSWWNPNKVKLGKVPPVLVSECYNDVKDIAAEGSGFDPEWEKKGHW